MLTCEKLTSRRQFLGGSLGFAAAVLAPQRGFTAPPRPPLEFRSLGHDVWMHISWLGEPGDYYGSNGLVIFGGDHVLLVDTPWTVPYTDDLLGRIKAVRDIRLVITHAHDDRMGGLDSIQTHGIPSLASLATVQAAASKDLGIIDHAWEGRSHHLDLGGRRIELFYPGPAHTPDNSVVYIEDCNLLFGGCMVRAKAKDNLGGLEHADVCRWKSSIETLERRYKKARIVVPGHGEPGGFELLTHTAALAEAERQRNNCGSARL
jgi:glyoxylase-like metal-dependent hydrolase (beta-lactamase superfamily II)